jgi:hypothetical protein
MESTEVNLQLLLDERAIRRCILRFCHGTDRQDWQMVSSCFMPGAVDDHGAFRGSIDELTDWLADKSKKRGAKQHYVANQTIEISGDVAVVESYYYCYIEFVNDPDFGGRDEPTAVIMGGRYLDRMERYDGDWLISDRSVLLDWSRNLGDPVPWVAPASDSFSPGRHDGQDSAQLALAEMRGAHADGPRS